MHIFLMRGDLIVLCVHKVVSTNYFFFAGQCVHRTLYPETLGKTLGREFAVYPRYQQKIGVTWNLLKALFWMWFSNKTGQ